MKNNKSKLIKIISVVIILYAIGLKAMPENMPFSSQADKDNFYAPHAGQCVPELEF